MLHSPLPDISSPCLSRQFVLDLPNIEITSLDITSHGCYILAGCSNGMVVLYDMTSNDENGTLVGHIRAKGMHTNLLVTVKFSPDNRFGFAGVMKGSMEMLAIDVGQIPVWHESALVGGKPVPKVTGRKGKGAITVDQLGLRSVSKAAPLVCTYSHLDPKLRGFGAVTRLRSEDGRYLLICGRGIKNVHVWQFTSSSEHDVSPKWTCLYDVTTNGVSIEALGFRERLVQPDPSVISSVPTFKLEMYSKSSGNGIRVWDLSHFDEESNISSNKIPYEDIPTSTDCRAFSENGEMAFGGTYSFATMKLDSPKDTLREIFEVPSPTLEDDNGQRRRRHMRQIQDILTTQDGEHAVAICTDGGVLYYHHTYLSETESSGSFVELPTLMREVEVGPEFMTDGAWALKRVGRRGAVVLVRACRNVLPKSKEGEEGCRGSLVDISLLSDLVPDDVRETAISINDDTQTQVSVKSPLQIPDNLVWTKWNCYYHDPAPTLDWDNQLNAALRSSSPNQSLFDDAISESSEPPMPPSAPRGRPPSGKNKVAKPQPVVLPKVVEISTPSSDRSSSSREHATPSSRASSPLFSTPSSTIRRQRDIDPSLLTPTLSDNGTNLDHITQISPLCFLDSSPASHCNDRESAFLLAEPIFPMSLPGTPLRDNIEADLQSTLSHSPPQARRDVSNSSLSSATPDLQKKVEKKKRPHQSTSTGSHCEVEPSLKRREIPLGPTPRVIRTVPSSAILPSPPLHPWISQFQIFKQSLFRSPSDTSSTVVPQSDRFQSLLLEQSRLRTLFYSDCLRDIQKIIESSLHRNVSDIRFTCHQTLQSNINRYRSTVDEVIRRQKMEMRMNIHREKVMNEDFNCDGEVGEWSFRHLDMFTSLPKQVEDYLHSIESMETPNQLPVSAPISQTQLHAAVLV